MRPRARLPLVAAIGAAPATRSMARDLPRLRDARIVVIGSTPGEAAETANLLGGRAAGGAGISSAAGADLVILAGGTQAAEAPRGAENLLRVCPEAVVIVCGPRSNSRAAAFLEASRFPPSRVLSTGGVAAQEAVARETARRLGLDSCQVNVLLVGGDAPELRTLSRYTAVAGIPLRDMPAGPAAPGGQAFWTGGAEATAPGSAGRESRAVLRLAAAVLRDKRQVLCCGVRVDGALGLPPCFATLPVVIGRGGIREIFPVQLTLDEKSFLQRAAQTGAGRTT